MWGCVRAFQSFTFVSFVFRTLVLDIVPIGHERFVDNFRTFVAKAYINILLSTFSDRVSYINFEIDVNITDAVMNIILLVSFFSLHTNLNVV